MQTSQRLMSFDSNLWSDLAIPGLPPALKRYLLALIAATIAFQILFEWTIQRNLTLASFAVHKPTVDIVCTTTLVLAILSLLGLSLVRRTGESH